MSLFGSQRDFALIRKMNRSLLRNIVEQEVGYFKISLEETQANIYGESSKKVFNEPVKLNCLVSRNGQVFSQDDFGTDVSREISFAFLKDDLVDIDLMAEVGDIIQWHNDFYEIDATIENQFLVGKDNNYNLPGRSADYGASISVICSAHLTRADKLGITPVRL